MSTFIKVIAGALICLIMYLILNKQNKDISLLLTIAACCMILISSITYLQPIIDFFVRLENLGGLNPDIVKILFQCVGIGVLSEISSMVCCDAGNTSLAKSIQMVAITVIIYLSLPLFSGMLDIVTGILGEI